jgi:DNA-binding CsgD family transcriptional regulator/tetratricopeptide (TPR) repeat protein
MKVPDSLRAAGVTSREAEVLDALVARFTNAEIAERLYISVRTVESHVSALLRKLAEPDRRALATRARELFEPEPVPFPRSLEVAREQSPLVGRLDELHSLESSANKTLTAGVRRLALVTGEAGIGKSRLAAEAAARMQPAGAAVIHGRCLEDALIPYQEFGEAVRPLLDTDDDPITSLSQNEADDPETARYRFFEDFDRLLAASRASVVFVLDDVQWADASGLQLLRHLLHRVDRSPLFIIATGRPEAADPRHPLAGTLAFAQSTGAIEVMALRGLTLQEAEILAEHLRAFDIERARTAWERTGGNPFLLTELLRSPQVGGKLPPTARDAIVRRVAGLGPTVFESLAAAAIAGEVFKVDLVIAALGGDASAYLSAIERAFGAGLVVEDGTRPGTLRFAHAIVREALVAVISPSQRSRLHLKFADALETMGRGAVAPDAARHRHAALPEGDPVRAHRAALTAFDHSMNGLAYEIAASFADMALDAIDAGGGDEIDRAEALLRRGRAHLRSGDLQRATTDCRHALEVATRHNARRLRAECVLTWADASPLWGRDRDLLAALEEILIDGVDDVGLRSRLKARLSQLLYYEGDRDRRLRLGREAVADARQSGRGDVLASVLAATHAATWDPADLDHRVAIAAEIVGVAESSLSPESEMQGLGWLAVDLLEAGDLRAADHALARHKTLAERLRQRLPLRDVELWAGMRAILDGRFEDAPEHIDRARDLGEAARDQSTKSIDLVQRYWLAVERGNHAELDELVEQCERIAAENAQVPAWRASLALLHTRRGDDRSARVEFEKLVVDDFLSIPRDAVWLNAMTYLAETCSFLQDEKVAAPLFDILKPYSGRVAIIDRALACKGSIDRFLGLLASTRGKVDEAERLLRYALQQHERMQAVPLADRTRRELEHLGRE